MKGRSITSTPVFEHGKSFHGGKSQNPEMGKDPKRMSFQEQLQRGSRVTEDLFCLGFDLILTLGAGKSCERSQMNA